MKSLRKIIFIVAAVAALAPSPLFACAACYGKSSDPLAFGMNWGIFTLLGVVAFTLASVATFFFFIIRRETALAKKAAEQNLSEVKA